MTERPNFFSLLDLDPRMPWLKEDFEYRLRMKKYEWDKKSKLPDRKGLEYREYLDLIPLIEEVMNDELKRSQERANIKRPNFFSLLDLDPQKPWSQEDFEQKLHQKRAEWSKKSKIPGKRRQNLSRILPSCFSN